MVELTPRSCYIAARDDVPFPAGKGVLNPFFKEKISPAQLFSLPMEMQGMHGYGLNRTLQNSGEVSRRMFLQAAIMQSYSQVIKWEDCQDQTFTELKSATRHGRDLKSF